MCQPQGMIKLACMKCMCICSENIEDILLPIRLEILARAQGLVRELQSPLEWARWPLRPRSAVEKYNNSEEACDKAWTSDLLRFEQAESSMVNAFGEDTTIT